jgi:hypothetical protein
VQTDFFDQRCADEGAYRQVVSLREAIRARARSRWAARVAGVLTAEQIITIRAALAGRRIVVCFGGGVDSTGLLVLLYAADIPVELVTFANTRGEKPETYAHVELMNKLLVEWGYPEVTICMKRTLASTGYDDLEGNCVDNETLPSLAFGLKSCSIKWKHKPQDAVVMGVKRGPNKQPAHPLWVETQAKGERILKLIGYDAGKADVRRSKNLAEFDKSFDYCYPLQLIGWRRSDCVRAITQALGPKYVPIKSACFFCPASKQWELYWLAGHHPDLFERALVMEYNALTGKHSRFDSIEFGASWEDLVRNADRFPSSNTTVGLGRSFAWNHWARINGVVDENFRVRRELSGRFIEMADQLRGDDNALDARACA